ncbi:MAG: hypothetical protein ACRD16_02140, partial [Thermoanaerobaculia bacterium]
QSIGEPFGDPQGCALAELTDPFESTGVLVRILDETPNTIAIQDLGDKLEIRFGGEADELEVAKSEGDSVAPRPRPVSDHEIEPALTRFGP